ncbi:hypothetical protein BACCELL_01094 [Bacteroides cellulosilyticus DSM 14838]|uniref:Uncharacterized protein n=1 Tax=Bacteroides cellulosilyticus DSM 14838 TaxID=537012 RepID=E2N9Z6_9BACE|nr:hypothetical protein BACCELL_01094 [Bacteroides cellulosilyticus DSM 14838]
MLILDHKTACFQMLFNTLSVFSSFSLSAYLKLPVHRHSG